MQIVELEMVPLSLRPVLQRLYDMKTTQSALREGVLFSTKRNNYYYDTGTGKVIVLDDDTSYIFRVLFDPTLSAETFLISLTKVDPNAVKNLLQTIDAERLFQRPPLLSMGKEIAAGVTDTEQKVEQIILEVTEQCNFRCKYCVYSEDFSGNRDFGNRRMPTEIAFKAIDWALENSGAKLAITFYGGEPLLNFKLMKAVIERSQAKRGNKEIVYSFTSNMSLMTREIATYLAQVPNLYIMASIDGPRTVHDAYRVYANDAPTFEDSIGGLRILADAYAGSHMPVNINAVLTPPFGFEKLEQVNASAIFQDFIKYPFTAEENITISDLENANDLHRLSKVIDDAGAAEVIDGLPHRLQTQLQKGWNGGTELSQGQWQKIAIARCLFKQSDVYLFDEPFSALDAISEQHIIKRLNLKTKMSITIFITHRYSSLRLADFILVLKDGELVESGSHQELQKAGKYYSELIKAQIEPIDHLAQLDET